MLHSPNLFIVGAPKAGTTFLFEKLKGHPDLFFPKVKELNYFSYPELKAESYYRDFKIKDDEKYQSLYNKVNKEHYAIDASVSYFAYPDVATRVYDFNPGAKIIIMLRDPVKRAFSHYLMDKRMAYADKPFMEYLKNKEKYPAHYRQYIGNSHYAKNVTRYVQIFGKNNVLLLHLERMEGLLPKVFEFLGIRDISNEISTEERINQNKEAKNGIARFFQKNRNITENLKLIMPRSIIKKVNVTLYQAAKKKEMTPQEKIKVEELLRKDIRFFNEL